MHLTTDYLDRIAFHCFFIRYSLKEREHLGQNVDASFHRILLSQMLLQLRDDGSHKDPTSTWRWRWKQRNISHIISSHRHSNHSARNVFPYSVFFAIMHKMSSPLKKQTKQLKKKLRKLNIFFHFPSPPPKYYYYY